jgi:hypothetical protein
MILYNKKFRSCCLIDEIKNVGSFCGLDPSESHDADQES